MNMMLCFLVLRSFGKAVAASDGGGFEHLDSVGQKGWMMSI
jgi:hypothetical protein